MKSKEDCVCCQWLSIISCGDTNNHAHPYCAKKGELLENIRVAYVCLSDETSNKCNQRRRKGE